MNQAHTGGSGSNDAQKRYRDDRGVGDYQSDKNNGRTQNSSGNDQNDISTSRDENQDQERGGSDLSMNTDSDMM